MPNGVSSVSLRFPPLMPFLSHVHGRWWIQLAVSIVRSSRRWLLQGATGFLMVSSYLHTYTWLTPVCSSLIIALSAYVYKRMFTVLILIQPKSNYIPIWYLILYITIYIYIAHAHRVSSRNAGWDLKLLLTVSFPVQGFPSYKSVSAEAYTYVCNCMYIISQYHIATHSRS